jgi:hypothetical protein
MRLPTQLFALPAGLLLLIATPPARVSAQQLQWPYNLPSHVKYYPEDEALIRRDIEIQQRLQQQPVAGVRKMSDDPGEMFWLDYWSFTPSVDGNTTASCSKPAGQTHQLRPQHVNDTLPASFEQPFPLHSDQEISDSSVIRRHVRFSLFERSMLDRRGFQCPNGTNACTALNPNVCCAVGETCQTVQDTGTGLGTVGCCPDEETCGGSLSTCPSGYTSCPNNPGGGCCIPGYACYDVGCVLSSTATVYVAPTVPATSTPTATGTSSRVVVPAVTYTPSSIATTITPSSISTSTTTITKTTSSTSTVTRATCAYGFQSCASSLGGGCCSNNMVCGSKTCLPQSSTASVVAPYRPTSVRDTTTTTTHSSIPNAGCPTGYYACSAYYPGGCCQIGRDCSQTSCPTSASTTLVNSNGLTIIAPSGSGITRNPAGLTGTCASGWSTCAATYGGGCCPNGYGCGTSCTATASGGQGNVVGKIAPNSAMKICAWKNLWFAWVGTLAMMLYPLVR